MKNEIISYGDLSKLDKLKAKTILLKGSNPISIIKKEINTINNYLENEYRISEDLRLFLNHELDKLKRDLDFYKKRKGSIFEILKNLRSLIKSFFINKIKNI